VDADLGELITLPDVADRMEVPVSQVRQRIKDGQLLAVRVEGVLHVPVALLAGSDVIKGLPGLITVLRDAHYSDDEALGWMFTPDDSLPGRPVDALAENRGTEVKRRAQALLL